jgi:uncharacterized membrane protein
MSNDGTFAISDGDEKRMRDDSEVVEESMKLRRAFRLAWIASALLTFILDFLIPILMFLLHYIFSQQFFTAWVVISFLWVFCSAAISTILHIVEALTISNSSQKILGRTWYQGKREADCYSVEFLV